MQKRLSSLSSKKLAQSSLGAFCTNDLMTNPNKDIDDVIISAQIKILEDAIKRYEKLEEIKKYTKMVLEDIETVTEDDIQRALELEKKITIEDDDAVQKLLESEGLLNDLYGEE